MSSGVRFRCYPSKDQSSILFQWIGHQRFIYNSKVEEERYFRTFRNHSLALTGQHAPADQQYSQFKDKELNPVSVRGAVTDTAERRIPVHAGV